MPKELAKPFTDIEEYKERYDNGEFANPRPHLRSLISRGSKPVQVDIRDEVTGEWRQVIRMSRLKFDDKAKEIFLREYAKWGRMGESAAAAGVSPQCVREHIEEDEEFAQALYMQEEEYRDKLIGHHQDLIFNGIEKKQYDRNGNLVSETREYPIRLIELELKKHDKGYRDKQEVEINHTGGVLIAPSEMGSVDDWEKKFAQAKDVTPSVPMIDHDDEEDED